MDSGRGLGMFGFFARAFVSSGLSRVGGLRSRRDVDHECVRVQDQVDQKQNRWDNHEHEWDQDESNDFSNLVEFGFLPVPRVLLADLLLVAGMMLQHGNVLSRRFTLMVVASSVSQSRIPITLCSNRRATALSGKSCT